MLPYALLACCYGFGINPIKRQPTKGDRGRTLTGGVGDHVEREADHQALDVVPLQSVLTRPPELESAGVRAEAAMLDDTMVHIHVALQRGRGLVREQYAEQVHVAARRPLVPAVVVRAECHGRAPIGGEARGGPGGLAAGEPVPGEPLPRESVSRLRRDPGGVRRVDPEGAGAARRGGDGRVLCASAGDENRR
eukprot:4615543-Pyramimonas_sp.AAC.1